MAGVHAGEPIAFIISDFCFLTTAEIIVSPLEGLLHPTLVNKLQICFCFDKSPINGHWQKFLTNGPSLPMPSVSGSLDSAVITHAE